MTPSLISVLEEAFLPFQGFCELLIIHVEILIFSHLLSQLSIWDLRAALDWMVVLLDGAFLHGVDDYVIKLNFLVKFNLLICFQWHLVEVLHDLNEFQLLILLRKGQAIFCLILVRWGP